MLRLLDVVICGCEAPLILDRPTRHKGGPRLPIIPYPDNQERAYRSALGPLVADLKARTLALVEGLDAFTVEDAARVDPSRAAALRAKIAAMRAAALERWSTEQIVRAIPLEELVVGVDGMHSRATMAQLAKAIELSPLEVPPDAVALVKAADGSFSAAKRDRWAAANARLIRGMAEDHLDRVAEAAEDAIRHGSRAEVVATRLRETTGIAARKAKLIARDQIASLQGQVTQARQTRLGVERYTWRSVGDSRVRTAHQLRDGEIFSWDRPPPDGHPGQPINCRCYAEPVLSDVLAGLAGGAKTS